ncbi:unnamed protein product [Cylicocyclus nassatus]|uniref:Intraflagellar transport protein 80 n=1 Tax=Cylicocyclus nassatus TaxID=53992 RepID=A0AA36MDV6_CYLNA|nr:unnamed protein product [Cylicocyclus nassatus]
MRLKVSLPRTPRHSDTVSAVGWAGGEEIYSYADDHCLLRWNLTNMEATTVTELPNNLFATSMQWFPRTGKRDVANDLFVLSGTDGKIYFVNKMGKLEKSFDAHKGAALQARWSPDGTGLLSCGEDGAVKLWSRNGMLRSVIAQMLSPVYCLHPSKRSTHYSVSFDAASDNILFTNNEYCYIKSLKTQSLPLKWKAHDAIVLCCDWSLVSEHIVTGGEDCKFKLWDRFGRNLFSSVVCDFPISSVAWSPNGQCFAVGSQNILRLCDKAGASFLHKLTVESGGLEVVQTKRNMLEVRDLNVDLAQETLETRDRITHTSLAHNQLIVVTTSQLYIYSSRNWNTPVIVDVKDKTIALVLQASRLFLVSDGQIVLVFNYDGRSLCEVKVPGIGTSNISEKTIALSNDVLAIRDRGETSTICFFDPTSGRALGDEKIVHEREVVEMTLSQCGKLNERILAFRDSDAAVLAARVKTYGIAQRIARIGSSVEHLHFNNTTNMLAAVGEGRVLVWPATEIAFIDRTLLQQSIIEKPVPALGKFPILRSFIDNVVSLRRSDGSIVTTTIPPFAEALLKHTANSKWDQAIRLCRHIKSEVTWAMLAGLATAAQNTYAAEIAYGALEEAEKVQMLAEARTHPNKEVRSAMMVLLAGKVPEADNLLEKGGNIYRAVMLNIIMMRWSRALDIAVKHNAYLEVVMGYRQRYLEKLGREETDEKFIRQRGKVEIDFNHIREVMAEAEAAEEINK